MAEKGERSILLDLPGRTAISFSFIFSFSFICSYSSPAVLPRCCAVVFSSQ
jgi:hypothetical protein